MAASVAAGNLGRSHLPLRDVVAAEMRRLILDGTLRQGERLIEDRLAEQLGVSRNPIREAIRVLEAEGFLDVTARRGSFVATLSAQQAADLFQVRLAVEPLGARLAAVRPSGPDIERMKAVLAEAQTAPERKDLDTLAELHTELHSLIFEMTGNAYLTAIAIPMVRRGQWLLRQAAPLRTPSAWSQHHDLIAAIEEGDPDLAEAVARHHVLVMRSAMRTQLDSPAQLPGDARSRWPRAPGPRPAPVAPKSMLQPALRRHRARSRAHLPHPPSFRSCIRST
jgi:DNA-binding GntR family transcriptional regulator